MPQIKHHPESPLLKAVVEQIKKDLQEKETRFLKTFTKNMQMQNINY